MGFQKLIQKKPMGFKKLIPAQFFSSPLNSHISEGFPSWEPKANLAGRGDNTTSCRHGGWSEKATTSFYSREVIFEKV